MHKGLRAANGHPVSSEVHPRLVGPSDDTETLGQHHLSLGETVKWGVQPGPEAVSRPMCVVLNCSEWGDLLRNTRQLTCWLSH